MQEFYIKTSHDMKDSKKNIAAHDNNVLIFVLGHHMKLKLHISIQVRMRDMGFEMTGSV